MGGEFGAALVKAGLSHLVITGRSQNPVYLLIRNGEIEIRDAERLKGLDTVETQKKIRLDLGDEKADGDKMGSGPWKTRYSSPL